MSDIYGVNAQTYHHLPPEDQAAIRESHLAQQQAPAAPAQESVPAASPPDPATAQTPQEAVGAIHAMPVPSTADLAGMPSYAQQSIYESRAQTFNRARADAAQAALDRMAPQRSDYASLNGATASYEFSQAQQAFNNDPYVRELRRIVDEANTSPNRIPSYLTDSGTAANPTAIPVPQMRGALALLGVELPENATPQQIADGYAILATVPSELLAPLVNPGSQVSFTTGAGSLSTPGSVRVGAGITVQGQVELSDVQTGVNFEQTQQFRMQVQTQGEGSFEIGKTPLQRIYGWADKLGRLPDGARQMVESSPLLRSVVRGLPLPVSGSYTEFEGARLTYEAIVTPQQGAQLADGNLTAAPNPLDPLAMPTGTSVLIRGQTLTGSTFEANYKAFTVGGTHTDLSGLGFGVRRGEGSIVEIYAGPVDTVENSLFLGLGRQGVAAIGISSEYRSETREMSIARLDLSTAEGQAAYQQFISSGQVPNWSPPGVQQSGTTSIYTGEHASFIGVQLGGLTLGGSSDSQLTVTQTRWQDGTVEQQNTYNSPGGVTTDIRSPIGPDGRPVEAQTQWTIVRADLDPSSASYLNASYDNAEVNRSFDGNQHVQMTFSSAQLMELRDRARASVVATQGQEKLDNLDSGVETPWWASTDERLAVATTPGEVFTVLSDDRHGGTVIEGLLALSFQSGQPTTGTLRIRDAG